MRRLLHLLALAGCAGGLDLRPFVVIAEPAADAVVYGAAEAEAPDARNLRTVRIVLHYYDLPPDPSALGLWIRFDRGEAGFIVGERGRIRGQDRVEEREQRVLHLRLVRRRQPAARALAR